MLEMKGGVCVLVMGLIRVLKTLKIGTGKMVIRLDYWCQKYHAQKVFVKSLL
ncbi:hypothetical protein Hanom_Chr17g01556041 [Helianthus anomalus]